MFLTADLLTRLHGMQAPSQSLDDLPPGFAPSTSQTQLPAAALSLLTAAAKQTVKQQQQLAHVEGMPPGFPPKAQQAQQADSVASLPAGRLPEAHQASAQADGTDAVMRESQPSRHTGRSQAASRATGKLTRVEQSSYSFAFLLRCTSYQWPVSLQR